MSHIRALSCIVYPITTEAPEHIKVHKSMSPLTERAHVDHVIGYKGESQYIIWAPARRMKKVVISVNGCFDDKENHDSNRGLGALAHQEHPY